MISRICAVGELKVYKYVVVLSTYHGKIMLSRHKKRTTWETQGGHVERGETPLEAAKRELYEESGAVRYAIHELCDYWAGNEQTGESATGRVFHAEIEEIGMIPESEMAEVRFFDSLPENLTYPGITPMLFAHLWERMEKQTRAPKIKLIPAKENQKEALFRLLQYSLFEESLTDLNEMNEEALFEYPYFDAYFKEPKREAYFIREKDSEKLLGFAMVRAHDGRHSIAEFMVLPKYRRQGIGTQAAKACFALHDGPWEVKPAYGSTTAKHFWQHAIGQSTLQYEWKGDRFFFII